METGTKGSSTGGPQGAPNIVGRMQRHTFLLCLHKPGNHKIRHGAGERASSFLYLDKRAASFQRKGASSFQVWVGGFEFMLLSHFLSQNGPAHLYHCVFNLSRASTCRVSYSTRISINQFCFHSSESQLIHHMSKYKVRQLSKLCAICQLSFSHAPLAEEYLARHKGTLRLRSERPAHSIANILPTRCCEGPCNTYPFLALPLLKNTWQNTMECSVRAANNLQDTSTLLA